MFENPRRGRQARNFTTNAPKILDLKSSSEQIFSRKLPLGAPVQCKTQLVHGTFSCRLKRGTRCFSLCCTYGTVKNPHGCWKRTKRRDFNDKCIYRRKPWLLKTILQMNYQTVINLPGQCVRMSMTIYYCVSYSISTTCWRLLTRLQ